ncbi:hypothetical protein D3872_04935 [Massilia cavernae]|uniref:Uncharacterized protein n=2 Tax=Massilia cavernae TaxID=2320864 RepID=A0A418Y680_9BURK|nr:hypothetical protein D3872_04935 [Massilia cavernae]
MDRSRSSEAMVKHKQPSKEEVREWLRTEIARRRPPPDPVQIRRELAWEPAPAPAPAPALQAVKPFRTTAR